MLDKLKQLKQLKELRDSLKKETVRIEKEGVEATVNGNMEIENISLSPDLPIDKQGEVVKSCLNEAFGKIQAIAAQKIGMGL